MPNSNLLEFEMPNRQNRTLTDEDIAAIVSALKEGLARDLYTDIGKGVLGVVKKVMFGLLLALATLGAVKSSGEIPHIGK